jgi:hypothetical protein
MSGSVRRLLIGETTTVSRKFDIEKIKSLNGIAYPETHKFGLSGYI